MLSRLLGFLLLCVLAVSGKRPLTHANYDAWRTVQSQTLSRDGKWLAYALFPQSGDGELVAREIAGGRELRQPAGAQPPPPEPDPEQENQTPQRPSIRIAFSADGRYLAASTFPRQGDVERARREKKDAPKNGLILMDLRTATARRVDNVKSFQLPEGGGVRAAYLMEAPKAGAGADLVLTDLSSGTEARIGDVTDYAFARDGRTLVYASGAGVYALEPQTGSVTPLLEGKGKHSRLVWDRAQKQLAFFSNRDDSAAKRPQVKAYLWTRGSAAAAEAVAAGMEGFRAGWEIVERSPMNFSRDGGSLWLGTARGAADAAERAGDAGARGGRVAVDLWHWKDPQILPVRKVRAAQERNRAYRAAYHIAAKRFVQVADPAVAVAVSSDDGAWAMGGDERPYKLLVDHDGTYMDQYLIDARSGERRLVIEKLRGGGGGRGAAGGLPVSWSPDGGSVLFFRDGHWHTLSVPGGVTVNLTASLGAAFHDEQHDLPGPAPSYGNAGWTADSGSVLLHDRYDVWLAARDGSRARRLTGGAGRKERIVFRAVRLGGEEEEGPRGWVASQPVVLSAVDERTRASGFWRTRLDREEAPERLVMQDKAVRFVTKAKDADVLLATATTFREQPDLFVTNAEFRTWTRVTNANPQQDELLWGSAELVRFQNGEGESLQAALYKPEGFDAARKYPLLVNIYERMSQDVNNFVAPAPGTSINRSYYVSNGYLVLTPDITYRVGAPGRSALDCVLAAIQAVVSRGFVDEQRIGVQGHSWGGYQIAYMVTQTHRFRAAVAGAPVGNMTSAYSGIRWGSGLARQFQYENGQSRIGGNLWTAPMRFLENSAVFQADRVATPVLMIHNDADDAVPWQQGIELYLALRRNGKEVYLFNYNGEKHNLRRRENQKDWTRRMQEYFDHLLRDGPRPAWMEGGER